MVDEKERTNILSQDLTKLIGSYSSVLYQPRLIKFADKVINIDSISIIELDNVCISIYFRSTGTDYKKHVSKQFPTRDDAINKYHKLLNLLDKIIIDCD